VWYRDAHAALRSHLLEELNTAWTQEENGLKAFFADVLEYVYTAIAFAWNSPQGTPYGYRHFNFPLKTFFIVYQFLNSGVKTATPPSSARSSSTKVDLTVLRA
jgi:hypothetical protein